MGNLESFSLALTNHFLLTQYMQLQYMLTEISNYSFLYKINTIYLVDKVSFAHAKIM